MRRVLQNTRGMALILTILIVSLIVALTLEFNRTMRTHVVSAANVGHGLKALYVAKSGVSYGLAMLKDDSEDVDSVQDDWADPEKLGIASAGSQMLFAGGGFHLKIEDLSGKIQINKLIDEKGRFNEDQKAVLKRFLELRLDELGLDKDQAGDIVNAIKDWIDAAEDDDTTEPGGAEDYDYRSLERPYDCKNGPLDSPEELRLVKGMTPEEMSPEVFSSIVQYISVFGEGKVNINTADPVVLESLHEDITSDMAEDMADYRSTVDDPEKDLKLLTWYKGAGVIDTITINNKIITTASKYFQITSNGRFGDMTRRAVAVVKREKGFQTVSWKIE